MSVSLPSLLGLLLLTASMATSACASPPDLATPLPTDATISSLTQLTPVKFTLSWLLQGTDAPLVLAIEKGYFAEAGLDVSVGRGFGSADSIAQIAAGQYDIGEGDMYAMMAFNAKNPNQQLVAVAIKFNRSPFVIVTKADSEFSEPAKLAGAKLAAPVGDGPRRLWPVLAKEVGVEADRVQWMNVEPQRRESTLAQGDADGISCFSMSCLPVLNHKLGLSQDSLNVFYYNDYGLDLYGNALIVRKAFLEANPEIVRGFVAAYIKGLQDTLADPEAALAVVTTYTDPNLFDVALESERMQIAVERLYTGPETATIGLGAVDPERLATTLAQVAAGFGLTTVPSPEDVFDPRYLPPQRERML